MKGQARKAAKAKAAAASTNTMATAFELMSSDADRNTCNLRHGQPKDLPDVCNSFMEQYLTSFKCGIDSQQLSVFPSAAMGLESAYNKYPDALNNDTYREMLKKSIVSSGASYFLGLSRLSVSGISALLGSSSDNSPIPLGFAAALMLMDSYSSPVSQCSLDDRDAKIWLRNLDIVNGCYHSLVKYFAKQTPCNCMDELYDQVKSTMPKMGHCFRCKQTKERSELFICTGCERVTYCSKLCQIAHVANHKEKCKFWQSGKCSYDIGWGWGKSLA